MVTTPDYAPKSDPCLLFGALKLAFITLPGCMTSYDVMLSKDCPEICHKSRFWHIISRILKHKNANISVTTYFCPTPPQRPKSFATRPPSQLFKKVQTPQDPEKSSLKQRRGTGNSYQKSCCTRSGVWEFWKSSISQHWATSPGLVHNYRMRIPILLFRN